MVTGAARADAALLVVDAKEGIQDNSRRHGALLALLGVRQVLVLVNKMDLVSFQQEAYDKIKRELSAFLNHWGVNTVGYIPVSGTGGDNIVRRSGMIAWYEGATLVDTLGSFSTPALPGSKPFRMWVQDVYKFTNEGDTRRIVAGTIESGSLHLGDRIIFHPSGKKSSVKTIEGFNAAVRSTSLAREATGFTLDDHLFVGRGELATKTDEAPPHITTRLRASLFWLGREPMVSGKEYILKIGTTRVGCRLEAVHGVQDGSSLEIRKADFIGRHEIADCELRLTKPIAFDLATEIPSTGRFVIVDQFEIRGGGTIREALEDRQSWVRQKVLLRDYKWERSTVTPEQRAAKFGQKPALVLISGEKDSGKKPLARALEASLINDGYAAYFLGIGNVLYGVDADIKRISDNRIEHIRRFAEVAHIVLDAGFILIATAIALNDEELSLIEAAASPEMLQTVWLGSALPNDSTWDIQFDSGEDINKVLHSIRTRLYEKTIIP
jgi:bifunctional enzyme CysN/CysC